MVCFIIQKKEIEKLAHKLMKDFYDHVHNDYMLEEFDEVKLKRKYYDENLTKEFLSHYEDKDQTFEDLVKMDTKDLLSKIEDKIKDETLDAEIIYKFLDQMDIKLKSKIDKDIDFEMDEDLFDMKKAFKNIYEVYHYDYVYLNDDRCKRIYHEINEDNLKKAFHTIKNVFDGMFGLF